MDASSVSENGIIGSKSTISVMLLFVSSTGFQGFANGVSIPLLKIARKYAVILGEQPWFVTSQSVCNVEKNINKPILQCPPPHLPPKLSILGNIACEHFDSFVSLLCVQFQGIFEKQFYHSNLWYNQTQCICQWGLKLKVAWY